VGVVSWRSRKNDIRGEKLLENRGRRLAGRKGTSFSSSGGGGVKWARGFLSVVRMVEGRVHVACVKGGANSVQLYLTPASGRSSTTRLEIATEEKRTGDLKAPEQGKGWSTLTRQGGGGLLCEKREVMQTRVV